MTVKRKVNDPPGRAAQRAAYGRVAGIVRGLASAPRLMLLQNLAQGPRNVETLAALVGQPVANTSHHLVGMAKAGLIEVTKAGKERIYRIRQSSTANLLEAIEDLAEALDPGIADEESRIADPSIRPPDSLSDMRTRVVSRRAVLLDVRSPAETAATPVPYALCVPESELDRHLDDFPKSKTLYVMCRGRYCITAARAVKRLRKLGFHAYRIRESAQRMAKYLHGRS